MRLGGRHAFMISLIAVSALLIGGGCKRESNEIGKAGAGKRMAPPVSVASAVARDVPVYLDEIGRTVARESVSLRSQVGGRVTAVHFTEGTDVKKGDLLFEIDPRPFEASLAQAEATVAQRKAQASWAQTQWKNVENIQAQAAISKEEFDQRRIAADTAEAQLHAAEAELALSKLNLEYTRVTSPIDGRTGKILIDPGNVVKENEDTLVTIQRLDPIYADFTITEQELIDVRKHMANGTLKVEVLVPGSTQPATQPSSRSGDLTFLDNTVQPGTGTVRLRATMPNSDHHFWPGQFVNVRLVLFVKKDAVLIPTIAEQIGQQGAFVYVVKQGPTTSPSTPAPAIAEMRFIKPGQRQGDMIVVEDGLAPGEQVVTIGHMMVQPGAPVQVMPPQQAQQQPGSQQQPAKSPA
jgi:multidrug efflux system membrane fusion protein